MVKNNSNTTSEQQVLSPDEYSAFVSKINWKEHQINAEHFLKLMKSKDVVILDLRPYERYKESHIRGAVHLGADVTKEKLQRLVPSPETTILTYCENSLQPTRMMALTMVALPQIIKLGYTNVSMLQPVWMDPAVSQKRTEEIFPFVTGPDP